MSNKKMSLVAATKAACAAVAKLAPAVAGAEGALTSRTEALTVYGQTIVDIASKAGFAKTADGLLAVRRLYMNDELGALTKLHTSFRTPDSYARSAQIAFFHGIPYQSGLNNDKEKRDALPSVNRNASKNGATSVANPLKDAERKAREFIKALRECNAHEMASEVLDVILENWKDWKESTNQKIKLDTLPVGKVLAVEIAGIKAGTKLEAAHIMALAKADVREITIR